jgi:hypothetical protein
MFISVQFAQSLGLLALAIAVFLAREILDHDSASHVMKEWAANCAFPAPGPFTSDTHLTKSLSWCEDSDRQALVALMNHMALFTTDDASLAVEFGVPLRVAYLRQLRLFLINPVILPTSEATAAMMECHTSAGLSTPVLVYVPRTIEVSFIAADFRRVTQQFVDGHACLVHASVATF